MGSAPEIPLLDVRRLRVEYPRADGSVLVAVDGADLCIAPGEIHGLVGESGAGKSTVGSAVMALIEPPGRIAGGEIRFRGEPLDLKEGRKGPVVRGRDIGMIFQDPLTSLNPLFTIESQLVETMRFHLGLEGVPARRKAVELLTAVGIPEPEARLRQYPHHFSGGMRQRVVIAMALSCDPKLVIADEPTTALDVSVQAQILELIRRLCKERGVGVLLVTHDIGVVAEVTDHITVMYRGRVVESGPTREVLGRPTHGYTRSLMAAVPRPDAKLARFPRIDYIEGDGATPKPAPAPRDRPRRAATSAPAPAGVLVAVRGVTVDFVTRRSLLPGRSRVFRALKDVSFEIHEGEVFGLVGESGSGKSTVANVITGLVRPTSGTVRFAGAELTGLATERTLRPFRRQMQMVFQDPFSSLNARLRVRDIVAEPLLFHAIVGTRAEARVEVEALLADVGLDADAADRFPHAFSGGQRQRISIARALATQPRFLICDEPTSSLDVSVQAQILNLLKDLKDEHGLTMLLISHDLPVIRQMCDRVAVMRRGEVCEIAATDDLFETPRHPYTRELLSLMPRLDFLPRPEPAEAAVGAAFT